MSDEDRKKLLAFEEWVRAGRPPGADPSRPESPAVAPLPQAAIAPSFIGSPLLRPLSKSGLRALKLTVQHYELLAPFTFLSRAYGPITASKGFLTDFGSVPPWLHGVVDDDDPDLLYPSIPHDYLYSLRGQLPDGRVFTRSQCDHILKEAMGCIGASAIKQNIVFAAVELGGASHWDAPAA